MKDTSSIHTRCVHAGSISDPEYHGVISPIYPSTSYEYPDAEFTSYPRYYNTPNQKAVARKIAALENGEEGMVFSSGLAAITTILFAYLKAGDHAVFQRDLYGGTSNAVRHLLTRAGVEVTWVDATDLEEVGKAFRVNTRLLYIETPSNPLLRISDVAQLANLAVKKRVLSVIDNTFASPINQNPLNLGMDIVLHSATKYLGGHSDICAGAVVCNKAHMDQIREAAINLGGSLDARTCGLLERSLKTLAIRVERQNKNAEVISHFLREHSNVSKVYYPGLKDHPGHALATEQMSGFGGMLSFDIKGEINQAAKMVKSLNLISPAVSLGGVETLISSPALTSHALLSAEERTQTGIKDSLLRLSVGIEDPGDLIHDLERALQVL